MVTREEAVRRARDWLAEAGRPIGEVDIEVLEFDDGFVLWPVQPPGQPGVVPETIGGARAVVDRRTGELTTWPMLPTPVIADRYRQQRRARERFPTDVYEDLWAAGWRPGRNVAASVDEWLSRTGIDRELPMVGAARAALDEFGGLDIPQRGPGGKAGGGFPSHLYPGRNAPTTAEIREFADILGEPVFPIGDYEDGPSHVVVDAGGRVFLLHPMDDFFLGDTVDAALEWLVRGGDRPVVDAAGHW
jgi:hypothetical protein